MYLSLSGFLSTGASDLPTTTNDLDTNTAGLSLNIRQAFPIADKLFGSVHASLTPRYSMERATGADDNYLAYTVSPGVDLYYSVTEDFFVGTNLQAALSSRNISLSGENDLYSAGVGGLYNIDDYFLSLEYRREFVSSHDGDLVNFTIGKKF